MRALLPMLSAIAVAACSDAERPLPPVSQSQELVVVTVSNPTTYFKDAQGNEAGLEFDLVTEFAKELGKKPRWVLVQNASQIRPALAKHKAHLAAANISVPGESEKLVQFGPAYQTVYPQVVYNTDDPKPESVADLPGKRIGVVAGSSHVERLKDARRQFPGLAWSEFAGEDDDALLARVAEGSLDVAIADSHRVDMARNYYPNLGAAFVLGKPASLAWAFPKDAEPSLMQKAHEFFAHADTAERLKVTNRLDARQSITAGAGYLQELREQLPDTIQEPDRTWLALAAYNLGLGHLQGGRQLARGLKLDPDSWLDMKKMLPLMSRPEYAARLKSGAARGGEAVIMTENIRTYYHILVRYEPPYKPVFPLLSEPIARSNAMLKN